MELFHRHVSDSYWSYWQAPQLLAEMIQEFVIYASQIKDQGRFVRLGVRSEETKGVPHDCPW